MDWQLFNGLVSSVCALALSRVVLSPEIHEGAIIKTGLITMIFALFGNAVHMLTRNDDFEALVRSYTAMAVGVLVVVFGGFLRVRGGKKRTADLMGVHRGTS